MADSPKTEGQKNLVRIFGSIAGFLIVTGIGYYAGYVFTWQDFRQQPKIGAAPLKMQLVFVKKDIAAGQEIDYESVEQKHEVLSNIAYDAYSFPEEVLGRKTKWGLHKGEYVSRHDVQPVTK
ncbi:MAG: hypothetical protein KGS72_01760 [Cyanobacteria bacterium REEB67]|nr:hypothetical protein [Cyanobacteria bacterium REEB67]